MELTMLGFKVRRENQEMVCCVVKKKCVTFRTCYNLDWIRVEIRACLFDLAFKFCRVAHFKRKRWFSLLDLSALMVCFFNGKNWKQIVNRAKHNGSRTSGRRYFIWLLNDLAPALSYIYKLEKIQARSKLKLEYNRFFVLLKFAP